MFQWCRGSRRAKPSRTRFAMEGAQDPDMQPVFGAVKRPCTTTSAQFPPRMSMLVFFGWPEAARPTWGNSCIASRRARRCFADRPPHPARTLDARIRAQAAIRSFTVLVIRRRGEECHLGRRNQSGDTDKSTGGAGLAPAALIVWPSRHPGAKEYRPSPPLWLVRARSGLCLPRHPSKAAESHD
jgi:hypothetical protein